MFQYCGHVGANLWTLRMYSMCAEIWSVGYIQTDTSSQLHSQVHSITIHVPLLSSLLAVKILLAWHAAMRGVVPVELVALASAPISRRTSVISGHCASCAARCRGLDCDEYSTTNTALQNMQTGAYLFPFPYTAFTSAPCSTINCTHSSSWELKESNSYYISRQ